MKDWEVLQYNVEIWDPKKEMWECWYWSKPSYKHLTQTMTVGHLWWKGQVEEQVITNGRQARKRALSRAIRRAESLLMVDKVRIMVIITSTEIPHDVRKLIWADGKFVV